MPALPGSIDALSPEQKAIYDLAVNLLNTHLNIIRSRPEAEARFDSRKDAIAKDFARATGVDAVIAASKAATTALELLETEMTAYRHGLKLSTDFLARLEKKYSDVVKLALEGQKANDEKLIATSTTGQLAIKEDLEFVNRQLAKITPPAAAKKKAIMPAAVKSAKGPTAPATAPH
jgi:hypothetical protein